MPALQNLGNKIVLENFVNFQGKKPEVGAGPAGTGVERADVGGAGWLAGVLGGRECSTMVGVVFLDPQG